MSYSNMLTNHFSHMGKSGLSKDIYPVRQKGGNGNIGGRQSIYRNKKIHNIMSGSGVSPVDMDIAQAKSEIKKDKKLAGLSVGKRSSREKHLTSALTGRRSKGHKRSRSRSTSGNKSSQKGEGKRKSKPPSATKKAKRALFFARRKTIKRKRKKK